MPDPRATPEEIAELGKLSTCEISDALIKLGNSTGGHIPDLERYSGREGETLVGEAFTVEMVDSSNTDAPKLQDHFVDLATPDSVVIISAPAHLKNACLGGLLATSLSHKGVKGVIIAGRCRDLAELRALELPVYARRHSTLGQSPFSRPCKVQQPVVIFPTISTSMPTYTVLTSAYREPLFPPTMVHPFDLIVADLDGVVVVRPHYIQQVIELAKKGREVDEKCRRDLEEGKGVKETFKKHRG
ncbi:hypothetical protein JCM16303_002052 [Sporobolomyces ruberrimus]